MLKIQLKVHEPLQRDKYKNIVMEKTMTMKELLAKIKREVSDDFCGNLLDEVADRNIRLRAYDSRLKVMQKPFEDKPELGKDNPME